MTYLDDGVLMPRDIEIGKALYLTGALSTAQLARYFSTTEDTIKHRLYVLDKRGYLDRERYWPVGARKWRTLWTLSRRTFRRHAEAHYDKQLKLKLPHEHFLPHLVSTNDLYTQIGGELNEMFGDYPIWGWIDEPRARKTYEFPVGERHVKKPDVEIFLPSGKTFYIERQTSESRHKMAEYERKARDYRTFFDYLGERGRGSGVIFVCDTSRDMDYADKAFEEAGVKVATATVEEAAEGILEQAKKEEI